MVQRALEILTDDPNRQVPFLSQVYNPLVGAALGFGAICFLNFGTRRPIFSGIQRHIFAAALCGSIGKVVDGWRNEHMAEKDATLRHYIELHPEDFPDPERKKFYQVLNPWVPIR